MLEAIPLPAVSLTIVCLLMLYWYKRPKGSPPGPRGIPFLGVIPFVGRKPERKFRNWSKQYGPVMSVRMGRDDWVTLNDFDSITEIVPNIWAVHNDPNMFDQPEKFDPGRHIDEKGNFVKSKYVIPFSVGPRFCLGEQLAKMELFLFLTSMVQRFKFEAKPGEMPNIEDGSDGAAFIPNDYELVAIERK